MIVDGGYNLPEGTPVKTGRRENQEDAKDETEPAKGGRREDRGQPAEAKK